MYSTPSINEPGRQLTQLGRVLLLLAAVGLVAVVLATQFFGPASSAPAVARPDEAANEAADGPPPPGSYHRPAWCWPGARTR